MKYQDKNLMVTIHRFDLVTNRYQTSYEGVLIVLVFLVIPILLGGVLMYKLLEWRAEYFIFPFFIMVLILVNLYIFYKRNYQNRSLVQLNIYENYIQILDKKQMYYSDDLKQLHTEFFFSGEQLFPTVRICGNGFKGFMIGLNINKNEFETHYEDKLIEPDYWIRNVNDSKLFVQLLKQGKSKKKENHKVFKKDLFTKFEL